MGRAGKVEEELRKKLVLMNTDQRVYFEFISTLRDENVSQSRCCCGRFVSSISSPSVIRSPALIAVVFHLQ